MAAARPAGLPPVEGGKVRGIIDSATVSLELENRPECVALIRSLLSGLGKYLELDPELEDDLKTAISEACNNVVLHAYGGGSGPLEMTLEISDEHFDVSIRDHGAGIQRVSRAENRMGVGLAVISALANRAEFESNPGEGTEVRMSFVTDGAGLPDTLPQRARRTAPGVELPGDIVAQVSPPELLPELMGRLVRGVAAGAHFAVDRFPALYQLTNAIAARATQPAGGTEVSFSIVAHSKRLELRVGPLPPGSSAQIFPDGLPAGLEPLVEELAASPLNGAEQLLALIVEPR
jgi:serine/threonine-protein kinase RsbW